VVDLRPHGELYEYIPYSLVENSLHASWHASSGCQYPSIKPTSRPKAGTQHRYTNLAILSLNGLVNLFSRRKRGVYAQQDQRRGGIYQQTNNLIVTITKKQ